MRAFGARDDAAIVGKFKGDEFVVDVLPLEIGRYVENDRPPLYLGTAESGRHVFRQRGWAAQLFEAGASRENMIALRYVLKIVLVDERSVAG